MSGNRAQKAGLAAESQRKVCAIYTLFYEFAKFSNLR